MHICRTLMMLIALCAVDNAVAQNTSQEKIIDSTINVLQRHKSKKVIVYKEGVTKQFYFEQELGNLMVVYAYRKKPIADSLYVIHYIKNKLVKISITSKPQKGTSKKDWPKDLILYYYDDKLISKLDLPIDEITLANFMSKAAELLAQASTLKIK